MHPPTGSKIISASSAAELVKLSAAKINTLVAEVSQHFASHARLLQSQPDPTASDDEWKAYHSQLDELASLTLEKHALIQNERWSMAVIAHHHMVQDLLALGGLADSRFEDVAVAFGATLSNLAIVAYTWAMLRTNEKLDDPEPELEKTV